MCSDLPARKEVDALQLEFWGVRKRRRRSEISRVRENEVGRF